VENRTGRIIVGAAGGTAGKNAKTYKVSLPSAWIAQMGLSADDKEIELSFDGRQISIRKKLLLEEFTENKRRQEHDLKLLNYYDGSTLCTRICADFTEQTLAVENTSVPNLNRAFGVTETPSWEDLMSFLEERCIPRQRDGLCYYLDELGLDEYDPLEIVKRTQGRMAEDQQWLTVEDLK